jgi:hypothetical protein
VELTHLLNTLLVMFLPVGVGTIVDRLVHPESKKIDTKKRKGIFTSLLSDSVVPWYLLEKALGALEIIIPFSSFESVTPEFQL